VKVYALLGGVLMLCMIAFFAKDCMG